MSEVASAGQFYAQLISNTGEAVIIAGNDGTILEWNASAARIFGWLREQAVGENIDMLIPDNQKDAHWTGFDRALESGQTKFGDGTVLAVSALKADGSRVGVEFSFTPLAEGGSTVAIGAIARPVRRTSREVN